MSLRKRIAGAVDDCAVAEYLEILCHDIIGVISASLLGMGQEGKASEMHITPMRGIEELECLLIVIVIGLG